ncbi:MAG: zinc ribbon domain-containing protein, partial [Solirubrobacteraceae bacterium]
MEYPSVTEPAGAAEPSSAVTQPITPVSGEQCAQCSAPLAPDQRYCLQCGEPRSHLTGPPGALTPAGETPSSPPRTPPGVTPAGSPTPARNNSLALLAGIGVLLLAMGVG